MKGQRVVNTGKSAKKGKISSGHQSVGGAVGAGTAAVPSPSSARNQYVGPTCTGCGMMTGKDVRALQCDRCCKQDCWKCIACLGITGEVYDMLIECKELSWFCNSCTDEISKVRDEREDKVIKTRS